MFDHPTKNHALMCPGNRNGKMAPGTAAVPFHGDKAVSRPEMLVLAS